MNDNLFQRASMFGAQHIRDWLPNGKQVGAEWVAENPKRPGHSLGSFSVNTNTGAWADFADPDDPSGGDAVSLYAYLNDLSQVDAAKQILTEYDPNYFPSAGDNFKAPASTPGDYWAGWIWQQKGSKAPPELDTSFHQKNFGPEIGRWSFQVKGRTVMWIVRFMKDGKKEDRPFTLWSRSGEFRWRMKGFAKGEKIPLWNVDELEARPNDPVMLFEGQKDAAIARGLLGCDYVVVGFYGGAKRVEETDLSPLTGREVWFPADADPVGRTVIPKLRAYDIKVHFVRPKLRCPKGWNFIDDNMTLEQARDYIAEYTDTEDADGRTTLDDLDKFPWKIVGVTEDKMYVFSKEADTVFECGRSSFTKGNMIAWCDLAFWQAMFSGENGVKWDNAIDFVQRIADKAPAYSLSMKRKSGAWIDDGKVVISTGENLIVDGKTVRFGDHNSEYFYVKDDRKAYSISDPLQSCDLLKESLELIEFDHPAHRHILQGWILLAPFGGVLSWRPNVWLIGPPGSGKTWLFNNIIGPCLQGIAYMGLGMTSSQAGIRQRIGSRSLPVIIDEMESKDKKTTETHSQILAMFRESSAGAGSKARTFHGTADGEGKEYIVQSMALFGSIGAALIDEADKTRFTVIRLKDPKKCDKSARRENFKQVEEKARFFTPFWAESFQARTLTLIKEVLASVQIMITHAEKILGSRREADQLGTLMAGSWMLTHDKAPTAAEAVEFLQVLSSGGSITNQSENKPIAETMMDIILSTEYQIGGDKMTIGSWLGAWVEMELGVSEKEYPVQDKDITREVIKSRLSEIGLKPMGDSLYIAINHPRLTAILANSSVQNTYDQVIPLLPYCDGVLRGGGRFAGIQKRYYVLDLNEMLDNVPF